VSVGYRLPRLAGRRIGLAAESGIIWTQWRAEGRWSIAVAQPLFDANRVAWAATPLANEILAATRTPRSFFDRNGVPGSTRERSLVA